MDLWSDGLGKCVETLGQFKHNLVPKRRENLW